MVELFNVKIIEIWWGITCQKPPCVKNPRRSRYRGIILHSDRSIQISSDQHFPRLIQISIDWRVDLNCTDLLGALVLGMQAAGCDRRQLILFVGVTNSESRHVTLKVDLDEGLCQSYWRHFIMRPHWLLQTGRIRIETCFFYWYRGGVYLFAALKWTVYVVMSNMP